jgi:hypothetical protein
MSSTLNPGTTNPDAVLAARADERLTHVYEQIARADEQLARVTEQLSKMDHDAVHHPSTIPAPQPSRGRPALRGFVGLLLAACIGAAAFVSQSSYGEAARLTIAQWAPQLVSTSSPWSASPAHSAQVGPSTAQLAAVEATPAQAAPAVQSPATDAAATPAPMSPELTQSLQSMAHDIAALQQGIEQLKTSQEQMAADNARAIEQLKASQEQMARLVVKPPEQEQRARTPVPPSRPVAANTAPKPKPAQPSQAGARSQPIQLQPKQQ